MHEPERFRSAEYLSVLDNTDAPGRLRISPAALNAMKLAAEAGYPNEICGLLVGHIEQGDWIVHEARQIENLNSERAADRFQLDPSGYQAVDRELRSSDREIVGVFHSHPDCPAKPSPTDLENAWESFLYPIISVHKGSVIDITCWSLNENGEKFQKVEQLADD